MIIQNPRYLLLLLILPFTFARAAENPKITLDEFFNYLEFTGLKLSPDGQSLVIATNRADCDQTVTHPRAFRSTGITTIFAGA